MVSGGFVSLRLRCCVCSRGRRLGFGVGSGVGVRFGFGVGFGVGVRFQVEEYLCPEVWVAGVPDSPVWGLGGRCVRPRLWLSPWP